MIQGRKLKEFWWNCARKINIVEPLLFVIKRVFLLFSLGLAIVLTFPANADTPIGISPLPDQPAFLDGKFQTNSILKALLYEHYQMYESASHLWKSLPSHSLLIQEHLFQTDVVSLDPDETPHIPKSEPSLLLISRFYNWQKRWQEALGVFNSYQGMITFSTETKLEMVRLLLYLGRYDEAERNLRSIEGQSGMDKMQKEILGIWLEVLRGNKPGLSKKIAHIEEDFLYLPISTLLPDRIADGNQTALYRPSLIRFPANEYILEQLAKGLLDREEWQALDALIVSQNYLKTGSFGWLFLAEVYLNTNQMESFNQLMKFYPANKAIPEFFDLIARKAIKQENWPQLAKVSQVYQQKFPELLDGKLYWLIYLRETGELGKANHLQSQIELE